jgi:hypothetical protein
MPWLIDLRDSATKAGDHSAIRKATKAEWYDEEESICGRFTRKCVG